MANLHITEYSGLGSTDQSDSLFLQSPDALKAVQLVPLGATSAVSAAFQPSTRFVRVVAGGPCAVAVGAAPVAALGGTFLNTGGEAWFRVPAGASYAIAAITDTL